MHGRVQAWDLLLAWTPKRQRGRREGENEKIRNAPVGLLMGGLDVHTSFSAESQLGIAAGFNIQSCLPISGCSHSVENRRSHPLDFDKHRFGRAWSKGANCFGLLRTPRAISQRMFRPVLKKAACFGHSVHSIVRGIPSCTRVSRIGCTSFSREVSIRLANPEGTYTFSPHFFSWIPVSLQVMTVPMNESTE